MEEVVKFNDQEVKVITEDGKKLINLVHTARCCGLVIKERGRKERIAWKNRNGVYDKLKSIMGAITPNYKTEIEYILDEIDNADDRNTIYMSS